MDIARREPFVLATVRVPKTVKSTGCSSHSLNLSNPAPMSITHTMDESKRMEADDFGIILVRKEKGIL